MLRKTIITFLSLATIFFLILTIKRSTLEYTENGVNFDGIVTYNNDAILVYGFITAILLVLTIGITVVWKKR